MATRARIETPADPRDLAGDFAHAVDIEVRFAWRENLSVVDKVVFGGAVSRSRVFPVVESLTRLSIE